MAVGFGARIVRYGPTVASKNQRTTEVKQIDRDDIEKARGTIELYNCNQPLSRDVCGERGTDGHSLMRNSRDKKAP